MRILALMFAVVASVATIVVAVNAGTIGPAVPLWRNIGVLLPSILAALGGFMCLNHPKAATYLLAAAALIFGLAENWLGLALVVAAGGIEFHFGRQPTV